MGRVYTVQFSGVSVTAAQDLLAIYCGSSMAVRLHGVTLGQATAASVSLLPISIKRLPATVTAGSAGAAVTPQLIDRGSSAATFTARRNDTTQATTSGTAATLHADVINLINGYQFFWPPADMPSAGLSQALVLSLNGAPAVSMAFSGTLYVEELF